MDLDTQERAIGQRERQEGDDQIGVITLIRFMWKWKIVILAGTLGCALVALVISALIPHVYKVGMLVENVQIGIDKLGEKVYLDNFSNMSNVIGARTFNQDILDSLREQYKEALPRRLSFKVSFENKDQFAKIVYETVDVKMGKRILTQLFKQLQEANLMKVKFLKKEIDIKIKEIDSKFGRIKDYINNFEKEKAEINSKIKLIQREISFLISKRNEISFKNDKNRDVILWLQLSSVLASYYAQLINLSRNDFDNALVVLETKLSLEEELKRELKEFRCELAALSSTDKLSISLGIPITNAKSSVDVKTKVIDVLEMNKKRIKNIVLFQPPTSDISPLKPDIKRNVVIGAVVGLFLSLFLAVFLEHVYKKDA